MKKVTLMVRVNEAFDFNGPHDIGTLFMWSLSIAAILCVDNRTVRNFRDCWQGNSFELFLRVQPFF